MVADDDLLKAMQEAAAQPAVELVRNFANNIRSLVPAIEKTAPTYLEFIASMRTFIDEGAATLREAGVAEVLIQPVVDELKEEISRKPN